VSTDIKCDGCGRKLGGDNTTNYWKCTLEGDTIRTIDGRIAEPTGMLSPGKRHYKVHMSSADLCTPCMSKTQEETTRAKPRNS
jgi:hypothetical protein